ncbi:MAG: thymidylate kinase [bacterium]|nr:MAG: thymidylate kinase [bacterium]
MKGKLIAFEGIDGVGKTTQSRLLLEYLEERDYPVKYIKDPSEGPYGQKIRQMAQSGKRLDPEEEYHLFMEDRKENTRDHILPSLNQGTIVIMDRYYYSTIAYQGALGLSTDRIKQENEAFAPEADLVFLIDLPVKSALKRIHEGRSGQKDAFEKEDYLITVQSCFDQMNDPCILRVDGSESIKEVFIQIVEAVEERILEG